MKLNQVKKKTESVTEEEIRELISFENENINAHVANWDRLIKRFFEERGNSFRNAINVNFLNKFETLLISGYADFIASSMNGELRELDFGRKVAKKK